MTPAESILLAETLRQAERLGLLLPSEFIGPDGGVWTQDGPVLSERADRIAMRLAAPYPKCCYHPDKCAGHANCQRDPVCID